MRELSGRVAVVTGGASGIGLAMARAFADEKMRLVLADIDQAPLDQASAELEQAGAEVMAVRTDVSDPASVEELATAVYARFGACHVLCNNAGVGAPSSRVWTTTPNDWRWVLGVNVFGVVYGLQSFVPRMLAAGEPGHIVNTSSPDGPISPLPTASVYAASKAAVSTLTECLAAQLIDDGTQLRVSIFYPSGGLLRTGLWTADRNRPAELARERPRESPPMTPEDLEAMARQSGHEIGWQALDELAALVVSGIREERFVIMKGLVEAGETLRSRADQVAQGELPRTPAR
jgi:NAD(P)-dependent dehydrogenase (short-subunit alcohol dehydrogenase family)